MPTLRTKNRLLSTFVLCCLILVSAEHSSVAQFVVPTPTVVEGLKTHAPRNFFIGGVVHGDASFNDAGYRAVAERDFNAVTSTAYMLSLIHISEPTRPRLISYAVFCL